MIEQLEYKPILEKLLQKSQAGRVPWEEYGGVGTFRCVLEDYAFYVWETDEGYGLRMEDGYHKSILKLEVSSEIVFTDRTKEETHSLLSDLYELARRKALQVPEKLAGAVSVLDRI